MRAFASVSAVEPELRSAEHGGCGPILFRRIFGPAEFASPIDFIDYTRIPPGSTIGRHEHHGNEEIYFAAAGRPLVRVNGVERRLETGAFSVVRDGESHELLNDQDGEVEILVIQVGLKRAL